ncbi:hypothetical protein [Parachlamydia sp. AcF125]|uniref:hypothetical protein n=1 Tax=Parachlamydia sp. AcF125 TaxID=2795736 RepID=UPI001BC99338|nr:hypothetical protein [Parachlamydia sp. AcF125]MBS4168673.1 hypothetical protein [Parachlamydia sp. AcF125]
MQSTAHLIPKITFHSLTLQPVEENSQKVKQVVELFIRNFSTREAPDWAVTKSLPLMSDEDKGLFLKTFSSVELNNLSTNQASSSFFLVGRGKYHRVWGHPHYPHLVFKITDREDTRKQEQGGRKVLSITQKIKNCWVQVPRATFMTAEKVSIYVEERLPLGLNIVEQEEFWARILSHYQSNAASDRFKTNLHHLVNQIQLLVEKVGFWDIGFHNLPEVRLDGMGVCGTDFGNLCEDPSNISEGIERLAYLFPLPTLVEKLDKRYYQAISVLFQKQLEDYERNKRWYPHGDRLPPAPNSDKMMEKFRFIIQERAEELEALQKAVQHYDAKGYLPASKFVLKGMTSLADEEKQLAELLLKEIAETLAESKAYRGIRRHRYLNLQPSIYINVYTYSRFISVLELFKQQGLVVSWSDDYKYRWHFGTDLNLTCHKIYLA